jgi:hypothetical protein
MKKGSLYSLAFVCALPKIGSRRVAFMISPLIFSFPAINKDWAFAVPLTNLPKSSSLRRRVTRLGNMVSLVPYMVFVAQDVQRRGREREDTYHQLFRLVEQRLCQQFRRS